MPDHGVLKNAIPGRAEPPTAGPAIPDAAAAATPASPDEQAREGGRQRPLPEPGRDPLEPLALRRRTGVQRLVAEAVNGLFAGHGMPETAPPSWPLLGGRKSGAGVPPASGQPAPPADSFSFVDLPAPQSSGFAESVSSET